MPDQKPRLGRKLLVATVGLASISYVACSSSSSTTTPSTPSDGGGDVGPEAISGNLVAPDSFYDTADTATDSATESGADVSDSSSDSSGD
jgi:hypothetical protein